MATERQRVTAEIEKRRATFRGSVGELEHKLDFDAQRAALSERITGSYQSNPLPWWIGAGVLGVVVVSAIAWAVFGDD